MVDQLATKAYDSSVGFLRSVRSLLPSRRVLPDYLIIGAQKAGTTSFHALIAEHPQVRGPIRKEIHYFDLNHTKGDRWYRSFFPRTDAMSPASITGEASPYYLFHPHCAHRINKTVPDAKLIVLVRDPVDRAVSHYHHEVRLGYESRSLERALADEDAMLEREMARLGTDPRYTSFEHQHHSYRARGRYAEQIDRFCRTCSKDRILIVDSAELYGNPAAAAQRGYTFLGIDPAFEPARLKPKNKGKYQDRISPKTRHELEDHYRPHNERLYELIGRDLGW